MSCSDVAIPAPKCASHTALGVRLSPVGQRSRRQHFAPCWLQLDVCGSTAVLLHACFHLQKDEYVFVFACTGDVEASSSDVRTRDR